MEHDICLPLLEVNITRRASYWKSEVDVSCLVTMQNEFKWNLNLLLHMNVTPEISIVFEYELPVILVMYPSIWFCQL